MARFSDPGRRAAALVVQPRDPDFDIVIDLAKREGLGVEFVHLAHPAVLAAQDDESFATLSAKVRTISGPLHVHGAFFDIYVHSPDPDVAGVARTRIRQSIRAAERLGAQLVVFHTNHLPCTTLPEYTEWWLEANVVFWKETVASTGVRVLMENMWDDGPHLLAQLVEAVPGLDVCLDVGHANVFSDTPLEVWFSTLGGRIRYIHLSDNDGTSDAALPPGGGTIDWLEFSQSAARHAPGAPVMVGVDGGYAGINAALNVMHSRGIYPFVAGTQR
jgi:sugar phosphate isomerase/epimerase